MDDRRFDMLTRALGMRSGRRAVVRGAAAALVGGVALGAADGASAGARLTCRSRGSGCTRGSQCCSGNCETSRLVPRGQRNRCACPVGELVCDGVCTDVMSDVTHCGDCDTVCGSAEVCIDGVCSVPVCDYDPGMGCITRLDGSVFQTCGMHYNQGPCDDDADCSGVCTYTRDNQPVCATNVNFYGIENLLAPTPGSCVCYALSC